MLTENIILPCVRLLYIAGCVLYINEFTPQLAASMSDESRFWYKCILSDLSVQLGC